MTFHAHSQCYGINATASQEAADGEESKGCGEENIRLWEDLDLLDLTLRT